MNDENNIVVLGKSMALWKNMSDSSMSRNTRFWDLSSLAFVDSRESCATHLSKWKRLITDAK